jgi:uncharacterized protein (TIGR02996 family)
MDEFAALVKRVRDNPEDDASWLVLADRLTEEDNPLGELISLRLKYEKLPPPETKKRRLRKLMRAWQARFAPLGKLEGWYRTRLVLSFKTVADVLAQARELSRIGLNLWLEVHPNRYSAAEPCVFDATFTRLAWLRRSYTISNQNHSPGMDEEYDYASEVKVWRVADGAVVFERISGARWDRLEFRADGLYAIEAGRAERLTA